MILIIAWCVAVLMCLANSAIFAYMVACVKVKGVIKGDYAILGTFLVVLIALWTLLYSMETSKDALQYSINFFRM